MKREAFHISRRRAIVLITLIIFQGIGWLLAWQMIQWQTRSEAKVLLKQQETPVRTVTLSQHFFQQNRIGNHEIRLNEGLYDIRRIEESGDSLTLVLYHDHEEEGLYNLLGIHLSWLNRSAGAASQPLTMWLAECFSLAFVMPSATSLELSEMDHGKTIFSWHFSINAAVPRPLFTPPRIVSAIS